jgi:hypothetical protein
MSNLSSFPERLQKAFAPTSRGVVGLVDDLLAFCRENGLQLDWQADRCRVRVFAGVWQELVEVPLRKSVFRAVLARVAALCNEQSPNSISPYGGQGEISVGTNPATVFHVAFTNTPSEQRLEMTRVGLEAPGGTASESLGEHDGPPIAPGTEDERSINRV